LDPIEGYGCIVNNLEILSCNGIIKGEPNNGFIDNRGNIDDADNTDDGVDVGDDDGTIVALNNGVKKEDEEDGDEAKPDGE